MDSSRHPQAFSVGFAFDLRFTEDVFAPENECLLSVLRAPEAGARPARCLVYIDDGCLRGEPGLAGRIQRWFSLNDPRLVQLAAEPEAIAGGEAAKRDFALVERIGRTAFERGICRHSYIIVVGGGAVLDAVGFAAALIHRGVRCVRIPTTTLAQCDAGLGVKNGVNAFGAKNFFGTFQAPHAIIDDARFLAQLDPRSWRAGIAEAFKVAIIKDAQFLAELIADAPALGARDDAALRRLVRRCALIHLAHIAGGGDAFERGSSRPLDFGHWSAHRLEVLSQHRLQHGEAVAIGVAIDLHYAVEIGRLRRDEIAPIVAALAACGFRLWDECLELRDADGARAVLAGIAQFREHLGGELTLAMPDGLGARRDVHVFDPLAFEAALTALRRSRAAAAAVAKPQLERG